MSLNYLSSEMVVGIIVVVEVLLVGSRVTNESKKKMWIITPANISNTKRATEPNQSFRFHGRCLKLQSTPIPTNNPPIAPPKWQK